jgi:hypothetical protein
VWNFLVSQPAPAQILVFGRNHDAAVAGKLAVDENGCRRRTNNFYRVETCVKYLNSEVRTLGRQEEKRDVKTVNLMNISVQFFDEIPSA